MMDAVFGMEEIAEQEKQELEYKEPNEDQGGIRRRLRDRDLLRKRKAEAEERETNQEESPRKRRAGDRSGTKKRGRPRKTEPTPDISLVQEEPLVLQEAPAVVVVPKATEKVPDQILGAQSQLPAAESQPKSVLSAPFPVFGSPLRPLFAKDLTPLVSANPIQAPLLPLVPAPAPTKDEDKDSVAVQDLVPPSAQASDLDGAPALALTQDPNLPDLSNDSPAPSTAFSGIGPLLMESKQLENRNQVTIEDLGPDEEEDIALPQEKIELDGNDLIGAQSNNISEQNQPPPSQEHLPGNSF